MNYEFWRVNVWQMYENELNVKKLNKKLLFRFYEIM
jgi:hypothetical protein